MVRIGARECQAVRILDADGIPLTTAIVGVLSEAGEMALAEVDDPGVLMDYFFGRGERLVVVEVDETTQEGTLDTRWLTAARVWWVLLSPTMTTIPPESRAPLERLEQPELSHAVPAR